MLRAPDRAPTGHPDPDRPPDPPRDAPRAPRGSRAPPRSDRTPSPSPSLSGPPRGLSGHPLRGRSLRWRAPSRPPTLRGTLYGSPRALHGLSAPRHRGHPLRASPGYLGGSHGLRWSVAPPSPTDPDPRSDPLRTPSEPVENPVDNPPDREGSEWVDESRRLFWRPEGGVGANATALCLYPNCIISSLIPETRITSGTQSTP